MNKRLALILVILPTLTLFAVAIIDNSRHHYENVIFRCDKGVCSAGSNLSGR